MKKSAWYVLAALFCGLCLCPFLAQIDVTWGIIAACAGLLILAYALLIGELKLFG